MYYRRGVIGYLAAMAFPSRILATSVPFVLTIARKHKTGSCTSGYLAVNGTIIAYTLELPYLNNKPLLSSIPDGRYAAILRYDHLDGWRIELSNVPRRTNIQIHTGNKTADSVGCILVGTALGADLCSISGSKAAYASLRSSFYGSDNPVSTPDKSITVVVES
jgi:hypothetical protein